MTPKDDMLDESSLIINEIESNLEKVLQKRKEDVEREFQGKIQREKEDSERKMTLIDKEFEKERGTIREFRGAVSEFETAWQTTQNQIRDHLERGMRYQQDIEKLTALTLEELRKVNDLCSRLNELRQTSEKKISEIRTKLKEKFGIVTETPGRNEEAGMVADLEQELSKLKKIKELLEKDAGPERAPSDSGPAPEPQAKPPAALEEPEFAPADWSAPERIEPEQSRVEFKMPEINQFIDDFMKRGTGTAAGTQVKEPAIPKKEEKKAPPEDLNFRAVFEMLEKYRKSESTEFSGEISVFQNRERTILDGESLIRSMIQFLENAKKLSQKLGQTESPKDQFFLKQELINNQEALRKVVLRSLRMCEKEACLLPQYTSEVLNKTVLKDLLEKLNMDNWSSPDDFYSFDNFAGKLKDAFYRKITPPANYLRSLLEELEG